MTGIEVRSSAFAEHERIPSEHSKTGGNVSPPLEWSGVPDNASELLLMTVDPDAPSGCFLHWLVTGISPTCTGAEAGETPEGGTEWRNGFGETGYGGPQPPPGDKPHRYQFCLYALFVPAHLPDDPTAAQVHDAIDERVLASGTLEGLFQS